MGSAGAVLFASGVLCASDDNVAQVFLKGAAACRIVSRREATAREIMRVIKVEEYATTGWNIRNRAEMTDFPQQGRRFSTWGLSVLCWLILILCGMGAWSASG